MERTKTVCTLSELKKLDVVNLCDGKVLGTVCDVWVGTITTRAHHNQVVVFTIPASEIRTGTQTWTSMHSHVHTNSTP